MTLAKVVLDMDDIMKDVIKSDLKLDKVLEINGKIDSDIEHTFFSTRRCKPENIG